MTTGQCKSIVSALKSNGCKVYASHHRYYRDYKPGYVEYVLTPNSEARKLGALAAALPKGGLTTVKILTNSGETFVGQSHCSTNDAFNHKTGFKIALGRAYKAMEDSYLKV